MYASVLKAFGQPLTVEDVEIDEPRPNEVVVQVAASGLCHSDLTMLRGKMLGLSYVPAVIGHEVSGIVQRVGTAVTEFCPGDHVVGCNARFCGQCLPCLDGLTSMCAKRREILRDQPRLTLDGVPVAQMGQLGGFAEQLLVGEDSLVKVPDDIPLDRAALLSCAALTGVGSVINGARVKAGTVVAVFGCGGVGLNVIQGAALSGARQIIAVDISDEKLELARVFGATDLVNARQGTTVDQILGLTGIGVDYSFECIGLPSAISEATRILRPGRTAYLVGVPGSGVPLDLPGAELVFGGKSVRGLFMGASNFKRDIPILADLYLRGQLKLDELIGERIALDQVNEGVARMEGGTIGRSIVML